MLRGACLALALLLLAMSFAAAEGAPKGTRENPYRLGDVCAFTAEMLADGSPRRSADEEEFTAVPWRCGWTLPAAGVFRRALPSGVQVRRHEAGAQVTMVNGGEAEIVPQDAFWLTLETEDGAQATGFQLMDAPLLGNYGVTLQPGEEKTLYKRFEQTPEAQAVYLVLDVVRGRREGSAAISSLKSAPSYPTLENGSRGEDVTALQARLIELGYLDDDADGIFGPNTEGAVRAAREAAGLDDSGLADDEFQFALFRADFPAAE